MLSAVFLKGFREAIGFAVFIVAIYLALNVFVIGWGVIEIARHPEYLPALARRLFSAHGSPLMMVAAALIVFPKLALGLSGFETGVAVMPLVKGDPSDDPVAPAGPHPQREEAASDGCADHDASCSSAARSSRPC